jgi:GntR family transcriptional regulator, transcriptional repressor for pyruvate dehydrogenase complex
VNAIRQHRVAESVAAQLRARILGPGGEDYQLPAQEQLMAEFGVSHPSIREAIRILETEGLVTVRRGKVGGARVHRPDESSAAYHLGLALQGGQVTLRDLAEGLRLLEPLCSAECARRADRAEVVVPALRANVDASAARVGDGVAFTRVAREFHDLVVSFTPSATVRYLISALVALWTAQEESWAEVVTRRGEYPSGAEAGRVVAVHRRIMEEIAAGNAEEARRVAASHLAASQALLLDQFDDGVVSAAPARQRPSFGSASYSRI